MKRPLLTLRAFCTILTLVVILAAALRFSFPLHQEGKEDREEVATQNTSAQSPVAIAPQGNPALTARDYRSDFTNLLAPFETDRDQDPFRREKRAAAFQAQIDKLTAS